MRIFNYHFIILLIFALVDVALYSSELVGLSIVFTILVYLYVFIAFIRSPQIGLMYLISFNLLTIGWGNYAETDFVAYNYYGLRIGRFTLNICFQFFIAVILAVRRIKTGKLFCNDIYSNFFLIYLLWTLFIGIINGSKGIIYSDNFTTELMRFIPVLCWLIFFRDLKYEQLMRLFKYIFAISIIALAWAFILDKRMDYAGHKYVVFDSLFYVIPAGVFVLYRLYNPGVLFGFALIFLGLLLNNAYFVSGKIIIIFICTFFWILSKNKVTFIITLFSITLMIPIVGLITSYLAEIVNDPLLSNKLNQVNSFFTSNSAMKLAGTETSAGNLTAEIITLTSYFFHNPLYLIFGKGMGAGIPDLYGFLRPFTHHAGYKLLDGYRNDYVGLHLSIYVVFLEGGVIFLTYYCKLLLRLLHQHSAISFLAFLMLFLVFTAGKDYFLLTFLLLRISYLSQDIHIHNNIKALIPT